MKCLIDFQYSILICTKTNEFESGLNYEFNNGTIL